MTAATTKPVSYDRYRLDRPGWIPESVGDDWDPHPYAYQTREELMPAGSLHGRYLHTLLAMLKPVCDRLGLRLFIDVFVFYRDWEGRKQRIAPDALFAAARPGPAAKDENTYDLDLEPVPLCAIEVISPSSREADMHGKRQFYAGLGISEYLLLDVEDDNRQPLPQVELILWRMVGDTQLPVVPDAEGYLLLECLGVRLRADGRILVAQDAATGEQLLDTPEFTRALQQARADAEQHAQAEATAREQGERARIKAEQARAQAEQRAQAEATARAQAEQARAQAEQRAQAAESELAQLRAELARLQGTAD